MASFNRVKVGDVLWDVHRERMGNTTMSRTGSWKVKVLEIDTEKRQIFASWNDNRPRWMPEYQVKRLRRSPHKAPK